MAAAEERPIIQANRAERARVLGLIKKYDWAAECLNKLKAEIAPAIAAHKESPAKSGVPGLGNGDVHAHTSSTQKAIDAGVLYFMTGDEDYAQFAADRLNPYVQFLGVEGREPAVSKDGMGRDYRDIFANLALIYDYIQPFLIKAGTTVYDGPAGKRIPFDQAKAQVMFKKIVDVGIKTFKIGAPKHISNIDMMEIDSVLYSALCIEDKKQRDAYVQVVLGVTHKNEGGLLGMKKVLVDNNGILPESTSYSGVGLGVPIFMEVIDRNYPELKIFSGFEGALNGILQREAYTYPNGTEQVAFGDSHREKGENHGELAKRFIRVVRRAGFPKVTESFLAPLKYAREQQGYHPNNLWNMDPMEDIKARPAVIQSTVHIPYAGVVIQKNLNFSNPKDYGLMYYTGGGAYVHSSLSGLDMELYGAGHVMGGVGADFPPGARATEIYVSYYRSYAGHNTVVVNGESKGSDKGWKGYDYNVMDTVRAQSMEPKPDETGVSKDFAFSCQRLDDKVNDSMQERTVAMVRTSDTSGYYLDLFRSKSNKENKFHDYIYHNIGDSLTLAPGSGGTLPLQDDVKVPKTVGEQKYEDWKHYPSFALKLPGKRDNFRLFPGWHLYSKVAYSAPTEESVTGRFEMTIGSKRYMHLVVPGGDKREYSSVSAPPIFEGAGKYAKKPSQVLSVRQYGEAWNRPFVVVFEPSLKASPTVQSVENIVDDGKVVGAKVISNVDGKVVTDLILAQDKADASYKQAETSFNGRFAIIRTITSDAGSEQALYIGDGEKLSFKVKELLGGKDRKGLREIH